MIGIGMKVRFVPTYDESPCYTPEERRQHTITGKVVWVNWEHKTFGVEFQCGKGKMQETFRMSSLGQEVKAVGK